MAGALTLGFNPSYEATGAVTKQRFVKKTAAQTVILNDTDGGVCVGVAATSISSTEATSGKSTRVQAEGIAWVEAGAAVTVGAEVSSDNVGRGIASVTGKTVLGRAETGASGAGVLFLVRLIPFGSGYVK